jgi:hypothetical protein
LLIRIRERLPLVAEALRVPATPPRVERAPTASEASPARVAATPGIAFGEGGEGHLRFVFKTGGDAIRRGTARIAEALARLPRSAGARPSAQCR